MTALNYKAQQQQGLTTQDYNKYRTVACKMLQANVSMYRIEQLLRQTYGLTIDQVGLIVDGLLRAQIRFVR